MQEAATRPTQRATHVVPPVRILIRHLAVVAEEFNRRRRREAKEEERVQRRRGPEADERRRPREYHRGEGEPPAQAREHHRDRRAPDRRVAVAVTEVLRVALREVGFSNGANRNGPSSNWR